MCMHLVASMCVRIYYAHVCAHYHIICIHLDPASHTKFAWPAYVRSVVLHPCVHACVFGFVINLCVIMYIRVACVRMYVCVGLRITFR